MAETKVIWSEYARNGFVEILQYYTNRNKNDSYSKKLRNQIKAEIELLTNQPFLGNETNISGVKALISTNYKIYYTPKDAVIEIKLIWDCRRNPNDIKF